MRINKLLLARNINDPKTMSGSHGTLTSGHVEKTIEDYDLYMVGDSFYIVRDGQYVAVAMPQGTAYLSGDDGAKKAADLLKRFPRPVKGENANS